MHLAKGAKGSLLALANSMTNNLIFQQQWRCIELGRNVTHSNLYMISYTEQHIGRPAWCSMPRNEEMPFSLFTVGFSPFFPFLPNACLVSPKAKKTLSWFTISPSLLAAGPAGGLPNSRGLQSSHTRESVVCNYYIMWKLLVASHC